MQTKNRMTIFEDALYRRSITSESQKLLGKLERKDKRRMAKGRAGADAELDWLSINGVQGFNALVEAEIMRDSKTEVGSLHMHG